MKQYYKFKEFNDHEGETWYFFVPLKKTEHKKISSLIEGSEFYSLEDKPIPESEVDILVKHSGSGYMNTYNKCSGFHSLPDKIDWEDDDPFYKGQCWKWS